MGLNAIAQYDEDKYGIQPWFGTSLLGRGDGDGSGDRGGNYDDLLLPGMHGNTGDAQASPLGSGVAVLLGLSAAYLVGKKRTEK